MDRNIHDEAYRSTEQQSDYENPQKQTQPKEKIEQIRGELESLRYFKTTKLYPTGTNTTSHCLDSEAISQIQEIYEKYMDFKQ